MNTVQLKLSHHQYPIYVGSNLLDSAEPLQKHLSGRQVFIVTNETIAPHYLDALLKQLGDKEVASCIVPDGEHHKTLETLNKILAELLAKRFDRSVTLIALGGGVIGDITGFAASCYRRGVAYIQIPTTLLAQVDASIGGKTGVNHPLGKNMIGAFHQPQCVLIDIKTLATLPEREFKAGLAEVIKYGLITSADFFAWLEANLSKILARDEQALEYMVTQCCTFKADFVMKDEREQNIRALLNFGHTFGHAIETATHYKQLLHGEAVAIGMCYAARMSVLEGLLAEPDYQRINNLIKSCGLPLKHPEAITITNFLRLMAYDKKVMEKKLRLILLDRIGHAIIKEDYNPDHLRQAIDFESAR